MGTQRGLIGVAAAIAAVVGLLTGCASGGPDAGDQPFEVAQDVSIEGSPTIDRIQERGRVVIGVKADQPGIGYLDAATGQRTGFDVDIARWIAASLGYGEDKIDYVVVATPNREQAITNGDIDFYAGSYTITDARKKQIDFAGPYITTGQGIVVRSDSDITGPDDLTADVNVCAVTGGAPAQNIRENFEAQVTEFDSYSQCIEQLRSGQVDAFTSDEAALLGFVAQYPDELKSVGEPFTSDSWGIGLPKGDDVFRTHINDLLENGGEIWSALFERNFGETGRVLEQPVPDRY